MQHLENACREDEHIAKYGLKDIKLPLDYSLAKADYILLQREQRGKGSFEAAPDSQDIKNLKLQLAFTSAVSKRRKKKNQKFVLPTKSITATQVIK